jgi:hypothetical protein
MSVAIAPNVLAELVARARNHRMSAAEKRAQRVSLIMGLKTKESSLTHEKVELLLDEVEGHETHTARKG